MADFSRETGELRRVVEAIRRGSFTEADAPSSATPPYEKPSPEK